MLDLLIHVWSKQNKRAIACLSLVPLAIGCAAAAGVPDSPPDPAASRASEETLVAGELIAPQPERALSEPAASSSEQPALAENNLAIDLEVGMQYADARARLLKKGWVPVEAPEPGPYGVERMAYDAGLFPEKKTKFAWQDWIKPALRDNWKPVSKAQSAARFWSLPKSCPCACYSRQVIEAT